VTSAIEKLGLLSAIFFEIDDSFAFAVQPGIYQVRQKMKVIPEPAPRTRAVIMSSVAPVISGPGSEDFACGNCEKLLIVGIGASSKFTSIVVRCPGCGAFNETP